MTDSCQICADKINQSTRKSISCPYCNFTACKACCETYILGEPNVKFINNIRELYWTRELITNTFSSIFINGKLKKHREQVLFDKERALLPATQPLVERNIKIEKTEKDLLKIQHTIRQLYIEKHSINSELWRLKNRSAPLERSEFIRACPDGECRGFLSTQWKCGICEKWTCPDCHEVKGLTRDIQHECDPDTLATAQLLSSDTKPCPNCRTGIFKIEGCPQMWCTSCNTGFNWNTGRIETNIHNPHYFEWLRRNGNVVPRTPGDVPCRNDINHQLFLDVRILLRSNSNKTNPLSSVCEAFLEKVIRNSIHLRYVVLPRYETGNRVNRNETLRIQYMRNQITEEYFKTTIQRNQKKTEKYIEIHNVLEILLTTITEITFRFINNLRTCRNGNWDISILEEIDPIVDYVNECLLDISKTYKSTVLRFSNEIKEK